MCEPCSPALIPANSHFSPAEPSNIHVCSFQCNLLFIKSAQNLCLTPFIIVFTIEGSFALFTSAKQIYLDIFALITNVDPLDIFFSEYLSEGVSAQRLILGDGVSIKAVFLIDAQEKTVEALKQSMTISNVNKQLPSNMARILSVVLYGVQNSSKSISINGTILWNNKSQNILQESSAVNTQPDDIVVFVGVGLAAFIVLGCSAYLIRRSGRCQSSKSLVQPSELQCVNETASAEYVSVTVSDHPEANQQKDLELEPEDSPALLGLAANIAHIVPGHNKGKIEAVPVSLLLHSAKENVKHIDFSQIVVGSEISHGSFKSVFRATWNSLPVGHAGGENAAITVALLVLRQGGMMAREIEVFEKLGCHPHLTKLLAVSTNPSGCQCLITEYAALGSLDHVLHDFADKHLHISDLVLLTACMQICDGMEVLTEHQLIHRDLAARNVLVFKFHKSNKRCVLVKITDYGLTVAGSYVQLSASSVNCGIPVRWMPPEASL